MNIFRIPIATYRLQFHQGFRFDDATAIVPYLEALGVTDVYASPMLKARPGSVHGYDVADHSRLNPELGGDDEFRALSDALKERGMGLIADVVPNHMEIGDPTNAWWQDVLKNGPSSPFASCFDIDWLPPKRDLKDRVMLPVLGDQFGKVLENGEITLSYEDGAFFIDYYENSFPVDPRTAAAVLETVAEHVRFTSAADAPDLVELESILTALRHLPERTTSEPVELEERRRESLVAERRLAVLADTSAVVRRAIEGVVVEWSGRVGEPESFDRLESLLARQAYRLCHWRVAADEINYRRFFDINHLAAIRVEEPAVFAAVHEIVLRLIGEGRVTGLRIDHPDGLYDPESYFQTLQNECRRLVPAAASATAKLPSPAPDGAIYIAAEKILSRNEQLPLSWEVHGTTGYEMLNFIGGVFIDPRGREPLYQLYDRVQPGFRDFDDLVYQTKKLILKVSMSSELHVLARRLDRVSEQHRWSRDFTLWGLHEALREVIACFPVYRTYVQRGTTEVSDDERRHVEHAVQNARRRNPAMNRSIFDFIEGVLLLEEPDGLDDEQQAGRREFVMKLQQLTGPVMAKGLEDTAFYRVYPLAALNEVGGELNEFGTSLEEFHRHNMVRCARSPYGMICSSTHDTKRSEDVRSWISVLSEVPGEWGEAFLRWHEVNRPKKAVWAGREIPDLNEEFLLYQTLLGMWPLMHLSIEEYGNFVARMVLYMEKALREAKIHTSWISPDGDYEQAVAKFVRAVLAPEADNTFLEELGQLHENINCAGVCNALGQVLLKITVPGVPDFYQGCETWNFCLVDPDNRRPVDYNGRRELLEGMLGQQEQGLDKLVDELLANWRDGRVKLFTTYRGLDFRRRHPQLFLDGEYLAPDVIGDRRDHVCAFIRRQNAKAALAVVPRFTMRLARGERFPLGHPAWENTAVEISGDMARHWRNVFTGEQLEVTEQHGRNMLEIGQVLNRFPVALLESL